VILLVSLHLLLSPNLIQVVLSDAEMIRYILEGLDAFTLETEKTVFGRHELQSMFRSSSSAAGGNSNFALGHILYDRKDLIVWAAAEVLWEKGMEEKWTRPMSGGR
jgi:hypothetical protein